MPDFAMRSVTRQLQLHLDEFPEAKQPEFHLESVRTL